MVTETTGQQSDGNTAFLRAARAGHLDKVLEHLKANIDINTSNTNGLNALHLASKDGHVDVVTELLKRGAVVDSATKKGNTALHIASLAGQEDVVKLLVANGASVNVQSQNGFTPLYMAAQENHDNVVRFLLANGANQSLATEDGFTPLAVAMQQGHDKVVAVLLENDTRGKVRLPALHIAAKKDDCKAAALLLQNDHNPDVTSKSGFTPLHIAAHYGNEGIGNLLLNRGADVNYSAKHNISPLHVAAKWGKTNLVSLLLEKGANIESKTRDGLTPLHCAARSGHEQVVDMMLERGAPISSKTKNGLAPLHMAAQGDHVDAARILLYHRAPVDEVTVDYLTALHVAAHCGHVRVAKLLLDRKADPNARALNGFTPLHIACKKNRIKVVELLLKHGGSIEATTESGLTPLHVASFMGCMNIVIFLLQNDASPDVPTVRGETPLHLAARANQTDIIRILLRNGAQVDARAREQQTPLHIASRLGNVDIVMLLLQHGAAVDSTTKDMYTALHIAAKEGQEEVASVLLEHGASLTATTKKGFTPLHLAAKYGNIKVAKLLLQKDAPVDAQGKNGVTPLHVASHYDHQNVALLLLDKGASPHATAKNGHTPLHIAARKNQMDIATTLLEYGAKANAESKAGFTPLHLSSQEGHNDMSTLLIEHQADTNHKAKNGLTPLHLCAQEDRVNVAAILVKNGAQVDSTTKAGYTPLHVASHFGQVNMIRFLLQHGADVKATTSIGYTPLHQAAQQGHTTIVNLLLENSAPPNIQTNQGQTPLCIAQKLGYISVVETLKNVTEPTVPSTIAMADEKYRVVAPETMQETFMSDSEDEGGEDTMLSDQPYRYLTVDEMKSLGDDSLPIDVTRDERMDSNREHMAPPQAVDDTISPQHVKETYAQYAANYTPDNVDIARHPVHVGFLVSFLVDARGGAMRGCRHSGVRVIVPPRKAAQPMRVTCRYLKRDKLTHPPPLMEGEALASRILELGPVGAKFLGPVIIEVPHFGSLRGMEREIVILRSDNGETWREHTMEASDEAVHDVLNESFEADEISALEEPSSGRTTRILTTDFPQYFAIVSRIRQEVHAIGPEGGMVSSSVVPQVQAVFPQGALTKKIKVGLQAQPIPAELAAKLLGNRVAVSPIVTVEPRRRKFHKPITLTIPVPQAANKGMINQYSGDAPTLRLLCSITGGTTRAQWEDVTGSTPLTFVNDCVSFTTTVSARFWLMDCRNIADATKMATELYKEAIHVPFMAKFVVFAKRVDVLEARLRVFCMTDDKEDKTLEHQEHFTEVAKSRDVEVLEGKPQFVEFSGNLVPVTKSGDQLQLGFRAFRENRLPFTVRVKDPHADIVGRVLFMREGRIAKGEPPQQPICILNIVLPDDIVPEPTIMEADLQALNKKYSFLRDGGLGRLEAYQRTDLRLSDISNLLGQDWVPLAGELNITNSEVNLIKSECPGSSAQQAMAMLRLWLQQEGNKANGRTLESALRKLGRDDIVHQCIFNVDEVDRAVGRVKLDQSGFESLKAELGPSRDTSLRRNISLDVAFDEQDIMKESESVEELVLQEKVKPSERLKAGRLDSDETETKYIGEEKVVVEEQKSVSELKGIFAADKRDRQYERQPSISSMEDTGRPVSMVEQVTKRKISTSDDRPKSAVEITEKPIQPIKQEPEEAEEETSLSVEEIRRKFSGIDDKSDKTVTTTVTKVTKKVSGIPVVAPKTPEVTKKSSAIPTLTQKTTEVQQTITKTVDDGSKKTSQVKEVITKTSGDGSKKVTETVTQKTSGIPKITQKSGETQESSKVSGIPVVSSRTITIESGSPKTSEFVSETTQEVTVSTKTSGIPVVTTKTTKVVEKVTKTLEDGKEVVTKTTVEGQKQSTDDQRRDSALFQGVSEELGRLETTFKVVPVEDGILSPKVAKTPPPSPAEFNRELSGGQPSWSAAGSLSTEQQPTTQAWSGKAQDTETQPSEGAKQLTSDTCGAPVESPVEVPYPRPVPRLPESPRDEISTCQSPLEPVGQLSSDLSPVVSGIHRVSVGVSPSEGLKGMPGSKKPLEGVEKEAEEKTTKEKGSVGNEPDEDMTVSDRKKFWEQMGSKESSIELVKQRESSQDESMSSLPQPRAIVVVKDVTKDFLEHERDASTEDVFRKSESESETMSDSTIRMHLATTLMSKQSTGSSDTSDREGSETEAMDVSTSQGVPTTASSVVAAITDKEKTISRTESNDSEASFVAKYGKEHLSFENSAYVSDDDRLAGEFEDEEPFDDSTDTRSEFEKSLRKYPPVAATRKTRSVSLPTEDLIPSDHSASVRAKKRYFEAQIKKEMVVDQLMTQLEEESSPEHKSFEQVAKPPETPKLMARQLSKEMEDVVPGKGVSLKDRADTLEFIRKESEARAREESKALKDSTSDLKSKDKSEKPKEKQESMDEGKSSKHVVSSVKDLAKGFDQITFKGKQEVSKVESSKDSDRAVVMESKSLLKEQKVEAVEEVKTSSVKQMAKGFQKESEVKKVEEIKQVSGITSTTKSTDQSFVAKVEQEIVKTSVKDRAKSIDVGVTKFGKSEESVTKMSVKDRAKSIDAGTVKGSILKEDIKKLEGIKDGIEPESQEDVKASLKEFAKGFDSTTIKESVVETVTKAVIGQTGQEAIVASVRDIRSVFEGKDDKTNLVLEEKSVSLSEIKFDDNTTLSKRTMSTTRSESKTESEASVESQESKHELDLGSREELSKQVTEFMQYKSEGIGKPSDSLEVHVDKSETEQTEKDVDDDIEDMEKKRGSRKDSEEEDEEAIPAIVVTLSGKQRTESGSRSGESDTASESDVTPEEARGEEHPLYQSREQFPDTVWEVPVQQQPESEAEEEVQEIAIEKRMMVDKEEQDNDYEDRMQLREEEARILAEEVVDDIEDEVCRRAELMDIVPAPHPDVAQSQVAEYLRQLTGDDLEPGDIELVESILERKHQEQMRKLARNDTTTSSMEITDEDLRSSGVETDLSPLESHMGKLPAAEDRTLSEDVAGELAQDIDEDLEKMRDEVALEKTLAEVRESLEAAQEVLIEEHKKKEEIVQKKESPSEFEFKVLTFEKKIEECIEESHQEDFSVSSDHGEANVEGENLSQITDVAVKLKGSKKDETKSIEKGEVSYGTDGSIIEIDSSTKERMGRDVKKVDAKIDDFVQEMGEKEGQVSEKRLSATISDEEDRSIHSSSSEKETRTKDSVKSKKLTEEREDLVAKSDEKAVYEDKSQDGDSLKKTRMEVTSKCEEKASKEATSESGFSKKVVGDPGSGLHSVEESFQTTSRTTTTEKKDSSRQESTSSSISFKGDSTSSFDTLKSQMMSDMSQDSFTDSGISKMESKTDDSKSGTVDMKSTKVDSSASDSLFDTMPTLTEGVVFKDTKEIVKEEVKRTSSEDSESIKSPIEIVSDSSSSAGRRGDSETIRTVEPPVVIRRQTKHAKVEGGDTSSSGSANLRADRRSGADFESSSGESHYHSFEQISEGRSRPCSSDVEGLLGIGTTGSSEYESALTSQEFSTQSATSHEYHTAVSSVSSRESMKSLDSESSGHLASNEVSSEASETLVPSALELELDMGGAVGSLALDEEHVIEPYDTSIPVHVIRGEPPPRSYQQESFEGSDRTSPFEMVNDADIIEYPEDEVISEDEADKDGRGLLNDEGDRPHSMKRSHEMIFQPEPRPMNDNLITDSPLSEDEKEEKFGSLEDGSILSVTGSYSSVSDAGNLRTVIEFSRTDSDRMDVSGTSEKLSMTLSGTSEQLSLEETDTGVQQSQFVDSGTCTYPPTDSTRELTLTSVTMMTSSIDDDGVQSVCTQVTSQCQTPVPDDSDDTLSMHTDSKPIRIEYEDAPKKPTGHRRKESTSSFVPSVIPTLAADIEKAKQTTVKSDAEEDPAESDKYAERAPLTLKEVRSDEKKDVDEAEREESYQTEADQGFHRDLREGRVLMDEVVEDDEIRELDMSRPLSQVSKSDSESHRPMSSGFSDDRPDSELAELIKQCSTDLGNIEDPIERPKSPEPVDDCEIKDDTPEFSSEAQASVTELEQEYKGAYSRTVEYASHVSPIREENHGVRYDEACSIVTTEREHSRSEFEDEMAEAEAAFQMAAHIHPTITGVLPSTIPEDPAAEKHELETREKAIKERKRRIEEQASPGSIPDIMVTQHMTPLVDRAFHYPDLELEEVEARSAPQTPGSASSCASSETDQGKEYILEEDEGLGEYISEEPEVESTLEEKAMLSQSTDISAAEEKTVIETKTTTGKVDGKEKDTGAASPHSISPESDSFEMLEKPDLTDDYVIIEEVGKEAEEHDREGKSVHIAKKKRTVKKHDDDDLVSSPPAPATRMTELKYYPDGSGDDVGPFPFESDSPPTSTKKSVGVRAQPYGTPEEHEGYDQEVEAGKKWIEMQFQGDAAAAAAAGFAYEEYDRGPLEDIKEEDTDFDHSSKVGSMGSYNQSVGSFGSVNKESYSSTPEYDVLAGKKFFTKSGEHDDVSMSSLQEFEHLEQQIALDQARKRAHGSQDSIGSNNKRSYGSSGSKSGQGDDISLSSLKDFEGLEAACIEAAKIETRAKEEESMLSEIEEGHESQVSESESCETMSAGFGKESIDSDDYEKRMFEIDEIIRQAQSNVERFVDKGKVYEETTESSIVDRTESVGRGDSLEEVAKVPELDLDQPFASPYGVSHQTITTKIKHYQSWREAGDDIMQTSSDSLDLKTQISAHASNDSLDQKTVGDQSMTASADSLELQQALTNRLGDIMTDSIEMAKDSSQMMTSSDSLELGATGGASGAIMTDSIEEEDTSILHEGTGTSVHDQSSSSGREGDLSSSGKEDGSGHESRMPRREDYLLGSNDSLDPTSSTATHATYHYETDSVLSSSFTSGGSNTMVSSTDTLDPHGAVAGGIDAMELAVAAQRVWFDDGSGKPFVTEVIEPSEESDFSHTIMRTVEMPPEVRKVTFKGPDAEKALRDYVDSFSPGEDVTETQEVDADGNVHIKRVVQRRTVVRSEDVASREMTAAEMEEFFRNAKKESEGIGESDYTHMMASISGGEPHTSSQVVTHRTYVTRPSHGEVNTTSRQGIVTHSLTGDATGEWAPRDPQTQEVPATRGAGGMLTQGVAAGSSGQSTTETRTVDESEDTMQDLLDKLAAEQRK